MKKVVIKVCMNDDTARFYCFGPRSSRCKAMRVATGFAGVQSVALVGDDKDRIEVVGERVDAVKLTTLLRKNVGFAEIVTVGEADAKKNENEDTAAQPVIWSYVGGVPHREIVYVMDPYPHYSEPSCSIM
ncbi:disease resistance protein Pik-1-like [Syzygium oleosum]|uniref:disease resistance protein Pik-1-like n=1 Tax=Syzygium oleosum TaxID=219896 RepID=UPI0011D28B9C|nr:disease resistance protein Pik-1-like [Syzygium oleosum]